MPKNWSSSAGLGTMGFGLPAAIGAQVGNPNKNVICISGDSSFQMNIQELGTIAQYNLPIKIIILNNGWQGMVRQWQESFYGNRFQILICVMVCLIFFNCKSLWFKWIYNY